MRRYETFNPSIPEENETLTGDNLPVYDDIQKITSKKPTSHEVARKKKSEQPKNGKKEQKKSDEKIKATDKITGFFRSQTLKWLVGLFMAFFAVYLAIAFISYFATCVKDQSEINNTAIGYSGDVANAAGEGGARLSEFLINEFFGLGSFVIIVWLVAIGLRMISGRPKFKPVNFTIKCLVALITLSLIVGLLTIGMHSSVNWGGYHGRYVNEFIIHFLGWTGAVILCIFMLCCFVAICMRDVVKWGLRQKAKYDEKRRIKKAQLAEKLAREQELEAMRRAEDHGDDYKENESGRDIDDLGKEVPEELSFEDDQSGFYNELPEIEDTEFTYNIEDKENKTDIENKENSVNEDIKDLSDNPESVENQEYSLGNKSVNEQPLESNKNEEVFQPKDQEVSDSGVVNQADKKEEENKGDVNLQMVVNINEISQTKKKSEGIGNDSPAHFPYKFPPFDLMAAGATKISVDPEEQMANKERIKRTLMDFDIPIVSIEATVGPTVTLYEVVPDKGIRVAKIRNLVDDIALSLAAEGVRIIAPIPGKGTVGIEVANKDKQTVSMQTVLKSSDFQNTKYKLPIALGSTISNEVFIADLAKMPHLLVAGATGQGKSVGLNAIIASLLYSKRPDELKFVMVDPKRVEFSLYAKIEGHYLAKIPNEEDAIITRPEKVVDTLSSLCIEMDNRYDLLKDAGTKNIIEYNEKFKENRLNPEAGHRFMPYIVVIIDEFSDLIMTAGKEVEMPIARLAQMARAIGIHVIIATQRPAANVITGVIRANFPARMAFKVATGVDSKIILDATGAQQLIGRGDMLVSNGGPMDRVQCAYIDTKEVEKIAEHIASQPYQQGAYLLPEPQTNKGDNEGDFSAGAAGDRDPLFEEVARLVVQTNLASTSSIQRRYRIGYNRAGSIMDQLEAVGIVGPAQGGKPRTVLMDPVSLDLLLDNLS